jgi:DNA-binding transcriptional MerR regulator
VTAYRIAELAERTGFSPTTLRYYEQIGVLEPPARSPAGYRMYDQAALDRLAFVDRAKRMGFALDDIAELVRLWADGDCPPVQHRMRALLDARRTAVRAQIAELALFAGQLDEVADRLVAAPAAERCGPGCGCEVAVPAPTVSAGARPLLSAMPRRESVPVACSLDAASMADRIDDWRAVTDHAESIELTATGASARFPIDAGLASAISSLASAEASCCPFLTLSLTFEGDRMVLRIDAPAGAEDIARQLIEPATS